MSTYNRMKLASNSNMSSSTSMQVSIVLLSILVFFFICGCICSFYQKRQAAKHKKVGDSQTKRKTQQDLERDRLRARVVENNQ